LERQKQWTARLEETMAVLRREKSIAEAELGRQRVQLKTIGDAVRRQMDGITSEAEQRINRLKQIYGREMEELNS
jgi:hypothetical protein